MAGSVAFLAANLAGGALLSGARREPRGAAPAHRPRADRRRGRLREPRCGPVRAALPKRVPTAPARPALKLCIAAAAAIQASHAAIYAFGSIHWTALGLSTAPSARSGASGSCPRSCCSPGRRARRRWRSPFRLLALGGGAALVRALGLYLVGDSRGRAGVAADPSRPDLRRDAARRDGGGLGLRARGRAGAGPGHAQRRERQRRGIGHDPEPGSPTGRADPSPSRRWRHSPLAGLAPCRRRDAPEPCPRTIAESVAVREIRIRQP